MKFRPDAICFLAILTFGTVAVAYDFPLSSQAVREAYFFGQSSDRGKVAKFLGEYVRTFPSDKSNPSVGRIELRTPYQRVVKQSWDRQSNYSAQQAEADYAAQSSVVEVRVYLGFDNSEPSAADLYSDSEGHIRDHREDFWRRYEFRVTQDRALEPLNVVGVPRYSCCGEGLSGALVRLDFDSSTLLARAMRVAVIASNGRKTVADFALDKLK